jgi:glycosyltransferase involved in cell wall biosynthesis
VRIALLTTDNRENYRHYELAKPYFGSAPTALLQGFAETRDLEVHVISCTQRRMGTPEKLSTNTWFHLLHVPKIGWLRTGYQGCIRAVRRKLRELKPDIVEGQGTERECALCAVFSGFPNVVTIHGNMNAIARALRSRVGTYHWCAAQLERFALPRTLGVFCNSAYTESVVRPFARRTWRAPNALRREFLEMPLPNKATNSKPIILNIGAISPYKRQLELLELARDLHLDGNIFEARFIGAADRKSKYGAAFLDQIAVAEGDGFARHLQTRPLPELMANIDAALALVHIPAEEAFGLVVAEALSRNLKVFGTNVGGVRDIAEGVEGAELFPVGNDDALAAAIGNWAQKGCPQLASAAAEMRRRYHPEVIAKRHVEIYHEVLSKPP